MALCYQNFKMNTSILLLGIFFIQMCAAKLREGECEVCIKFLTKYEKTLNDEDRKSPAVLTEKLKQICRKAKGKENRFCYYVGGTDDAATYILNEITKPIAYFKDVAKICEGLKPKDSQICQLEYEKELDWNNINLKKMRVRELKNILSGWDETCDGCLEKSDYIKRIEKLRAEKTEL